MESKSVHIREELIAETLKSAPTQGAKLLEPMKSFALEQKLPFKILEDFEGGGDYETHITEGDLWYCLEGEVDFICGGALINATPRLHADGTSNNNELKGTAIQGGKNIILKKGDFLWIPWGEPHKHEAKKIARLVIIKIPKQNT